MWFINDIGDLMQETEAEMPADPELWPQVVQRDQGSAELAGLRLGMDIPGWPPENIEEMAKKLDQELLG
jgi:DNA-directed RNA polymerase subunit alpha